MTLEDWNGGGAQRADSSEALIVSTKNSAQTHYIEVRAEQPEARDCLLENSRYIAKENKVQKSTKTNSSDNLIDRPFCPRTRILYLSRR